MPKNVFFKGRNMQPKLNMPKKSQVAIHLWTEKTCMFWAAKQFHRVTKLDHQVQNPRQAHDPNHTWDPVGYGQSGSSHCEIKVEDGWSIRKIWHHWDLHGSNFHELKLSNFTEFQDNSADMNQLPEDQRLCLWRVKIKKYRLHMGNAQTCCT